MPIHAVSQLLGNVPNIMLQYNIVLRYIKTIIVSQRIHGVVLYTLLFSTRCCSLTLLVLPVSHFVPHVLPTFNVYTYSENDFSIRLKILVTLSTVINLIICFLQSAVA